MSDSKPELDAVLRKHSPASPSSLDQKILNYAAQNKPERKNYIWAPVSAVASIMLVATLIILQQPQPPGLDHQTSKRLPVNDGDQSVHASREIAAVSIREAESKTFEEVTVAARKKTSKPQDFAGDNSEHYTEVAAASSASRSAPSLQPAAPVAEQAELERVQEDLQEESAVDVWQVAASKGVVFRATGNEPGWLLEVGSETVLVLDYGSSRLRFPAVDTSQIADQSATAFSFDKNGVNYHFTIRKQRCNDTMRGDRFEYSVDVVFGSRELFGCGRVLGQAPER